MTASLSLLTTRADRDRQQFVDKYRQMHRLVREPEGTVLYVGAENWPFPFPLVSKDGAWFFDTQAGMEEILFRRIGENESAAIDLCRALARSDRSRAARYLGNTVPFHGYYFRALTPEGGKGASVVAYPADYRSSGVMTFIVATDGVVYERDLGPRTAQAATAVAKDKPDSSWYAVQ